MRLGVLVGKARAKIQDEKMSGLNCGSIEVDEIWGFIGAKRSQAGREAMPYFVHDYGAALLMAGVFNQL